MRGYYVPRLLLFVTQVPGDAVPDVGTQLTNERSFVTHMLDIDDALAKLKSQQETRGAGGCEQCYSSASVAEDE